MITFKIFKLRIKIFESSNTTNAGAIQGAFTLIGTLVEMGVPQQEIQQELRNTLVRAKRLEEKHPGLDIAIENGRAS